MDYQQIQERYKEAGIVEYHLETLEDLKEVHDVNIAEIEGLSKLPAKQTEIFKRFLVNFFNAWGLEARNTIMPTSVMYDEYDNYIKFHYKMYGRVKWLHVIDPTTWY